MNAAELSQTLKLKKLNLGCGASPRQAYGWVNQDLYPGPGVDEVWNLNGKWPHSDGSVDEIYASHVIEHVEDPAHFMREAQRVMAPGAHIFLRMPYGASDAAMFDPTHKRQFFPDTFYMFLPRTTTWTRNPQHTPDRWPSMFVIDEIRLVANRRLYWIPFWKWILQRTYLHLWNVIEEMWVYMHRLSAEDVEALAGYQLQIPVLLMSSEEVMKEMPKCRWEDKLIQGGK